MARSTLEVPWDTPFPQVCARCTRPADKVKRITRAKPSAQQWGAWFGLIGAAIASSRKGGSIQLEIPYCEDCLRQDRALLWGAWGAFALGVLLSCGFTLLSVQYDTSNTLLIIAYLLLGLSGLGMIVIALPALLIIRNNHQAVHLKRIFERSESIQLAFRNQLYFARFWQENLERVVRVTGFENPYFLGAQEAAQAYIAGRVKAGASNPAIVQELIQRGYDPSAAREMVSGVARRHSGSARKNGLLLIFAGILITVLAIAITMSSYESASRQGGTYYICYGAIILGFVLVVRGPVQLIRGREVK